MKTRLTRTIIAALAFSLGAPLVLAAPPELQHNEAVRLYNRSDVLTFRGRGGSPITRGRSDVATTTRSWSSVSNYHSEVTTVRRTSPAPSERLSSTVVTVTRRMTTADPSVATVLGEHNSNGLRDPFRGL